MASDLRPNLVINQQFVTTVPAVQAPSNPAILFGLCRQMVWREKTGDFVGGQVNPSYEFPGLIDGAEVEQPTAETVLRPHVFIQNRFGTAEVTPSYNWTVIPPVFDLSPSLSAVFEVSSGKTGAYSAISGRFTDNAADFIEDEVGAGDVVKVGGVHSFDVVSIISDVELDVTKTNKAVVGYSGGLTVADPNGDRIFTDATFDFEAAGVLVGDLVQVGGWAELYRARGIDYTAIVGGFRTMTDPLAAWLTAGVAVFVPSTPVTPATGSQVWTFNGVDWIPTFKVTTLGTETSLTMANLLLAWPTAPTVGTSLPHEIWNYNGMDLGAGAYQGLVGSYVPGTFTQGDGFNFVALLPVAPPYTNYFIVIQDADGNRPTFRITGVLGAGAVSIVPIDSTYPAINPGPLTWELWQSTTVAAPLAYYWQANLSATLVPLPPNRHTITLDPAYTAAGVDFASIAPPPAAGDIVYDDLGNALFTVVSLDSPVQITVLDIIPGTLPAGDLYFGFRLTDVSNMAALLVTRVNPTGLTLRNVLADPPTTDAFTDLYYEIYAADSLSNLNYTIEKTLTGSSLAGDVLATYTARRTDLSDTPIEVKRADREALLGKAVPANPLGLAAKIALDNAFYSVFALGVSSDTGADWVAALDKVKSDRYYVLTPLTQSEAILTTARAFVELESTPAKKRDKIMFQNHVFERIETRIDRPAGVASYLKNGTTTTITFIGLDLSAYGVIVGDDFLAVSPAGQGRIITLVTGTNSVITIVNSNGLPLAGVPTPINGWKVQSKDLTDAQFADKINAYPGTIKSRRIRNVYPDTCEITFTDDTDPTSVSGFYGGGDVIEELAGYYLCAMEAAKRSSQKPAQSLTGYPGVGIHKLLNPFGDPYGGDEELNDRVLDGGNYLMSQPITDGNCVAVRALTTDTTDVLHYEEAVTIQVDNFARLLRKQIRPLLGMYNMDENFFSLVSTHINAVRTSVVDDKKDAKSIDFMNIFEVPNMLDTFGATFKFTPFVTAAKGEFTIYI